MVQVKNRQI